jgi:hypothetical protein
LPAGTVKLFPCEHCPDKDPTVATKKAARRRYLGAKWRGEKSLYNVEKFVTFEGREKVFFMLETNY